MPIRRLAVPRRRVFPRRLPLIGGLIVTHGKLAHELLAAAQTIDAGLDGIEAVALEWNETVEQAREKIREALERLGHDQRVIIFTDMFGGTPSNISLSFLEKDHVEIVTGVNLPMIVKFSSLQRDSHDLAGLAHTIREKGSKSIRVASDLLAGSDPHIPGV
jgi:PTS system mannose-specific IIA component